MRRVPPEVLRRLFTPFFTTKAVGVGTGLGLSICRRIIDGCHGSIEVKSRVGKGTVFRVVLPSVPLPESRATREAFVAAVAERRGRILVVDDEQTVTNVLRRCLASDHEVTIMNHAKVALERVRAGDRFDVILCDLMMPQMTGMELHAELLQIDRGQADCMIFLTGGAFTPAARTFLKETPNLHIEKPFNPVQLRGLVNDRVR